MINIKLIIEYDGREFNGWQKQPNKLNIQGEIERAIFLLTNEDVTLIGSGRTDAGVHALGQVANFKLASLSIPIYKLAYAINSKLKRSIRIISSEIVPDDFHSRYSVKNKTYRYTINNSNHGSAIFRNLEYHFPIKLNINDMKSSLKHFIGTHDFKAFKASGTSSKSSIRTIFDAKIEVHNEKIEIYLTGNGFLYNMVRIIAGTLLFVGLGKIKPNDIPDIINSMDRAKAGKTLPPNGLYLVSVEY